jgi:hypothetical protein
VWPVHGCLRQSLNAQESVSENFFIHRSLVEGVMHIPPKTNIYQTL